MIRKAAPAGPLAAYVLHQYDWSESSLIVELFTRERGRIAVAAKGAKRPTSNFRPILLPFNRLAIQLGKAPADENAELFNLRGAEWAGGAPTVAAAALFAGFHMNELLLKLLPRHDAHALLFDAYAALLRMLVPDDQPARQAALRAFELLLLRELGWLPQLDVVTQTLQPLDEQRSYTLHAEHGVAVDANGVAAHTLRALAAALARNDLVGLRDACQGAIVPLRRSLRAVLHYHLGHASLRTPALMRGVLELLEAPTR